MDRNSLKRVCSEIFTPARLKKAAKTAVCVMALVLPCFYGCAPQSAPLGLSSSNLSYQGNRLANGFKSAGEQVSGMFPINVYEAGGPGVGDKHGWTPNFEDRIHVSVGTADEHDSKWNSGGQWDMHWSSGVNRREGIIDNRRGQMDSYDHF